MNTAEAKAPTKIVKKITGFSIVDNTVKTEEPAPTPVPFSQVMSEKLPRPDCLLGSTYKIKPPSDDRSLYIVINDYIVNEGTTEEKRIPFEIFIQGGDNQHYQWVSCITRLISAIWRKGGENTFIIDEMKSIFDPAGGYFLGGGKYANSIVAHIGFKIEEHLIKIGYLEPEGLSDAQKEVIAEKRSQVENLEANTVGSFPASASLCKKCSTKAVIIMDGCETCLSCGNSKCG